MANYSNPIIIDDDEEILPTSYNHIENINRTLNSIIESSFVSIPPIFDSQIEQYDTSNLNISPWANNTFDWDKDIINHNKTTFGHDEFRETQREIINAILSKRNVFVTMPTGGGKSLLYQLSSLILGGITIVIEPLVSLIEDQVTILKRLGISVEFIGAGQKNETEIYKDLCSPTIQSKIIITTPEKIMLSDKFISIMDKLYETNKLSLFVIDECHCVSIWGHDFRPQYKNLSDLKKRYPKTPILSLTATATLDVKIDIIKILNLQCEKDRVVSFTSSFNRPNLSYKVLPKKTKTIIDEIEKFINDEHSEHSGIIYCLSKKDCENVSSKLSEKNFKCDYYHAGLTTDRKNTVQNQWLNNELQFICATVAFGMGINKPNVRFVIHYSVPKSLEGYYQESGRAGRDGYPASCVLFFSKRDVQILQNMIHTSFKNQVFDQQLALKAETKTVLKNNMTKLRELVLFCYNSTDCRKVLMSRYFGERLKYTSGSCNLCDNCQSMMETKLKNFDNLALGIINAIKSLQLHQHDIPKTTLIEFLKGRVRNNPLEKPYHKINGYGTFKHISASFMDRVIDEMFVRKIIDETYVHMRHGVIAHLILGKDELIQDLKDKKTSIEIMISTSEINQSKRKHVMKESLQAKRQKLINKQSTLKENLISSLQLLKATICDEEYILCNDGARKINFLFPDLVIRLMAEKLPHNSSEFKHICNMDDEDTYKFAARFISKIDEFKKKYPLIHQINKQ